MSPIIIQHLDAIKRVCRQHYVRSLHVFGSAATGNMGAESDIDLMYRFDYDKISELTSSTFDYAINLFQMENELQQLFKKKVDLIAEEAVSNKIFQAQIAESKRLIYAG